MHSLKFCRLPHAPHVNILTEDEVVWSTVNPDYLVGGFGDLTLKHGAKIAGVWSMVGILDAKPFAASDDPHHDYDDILGYVEQVRVGAMQDNVWKIALSMARPTREAFGRPTTSFGATPLIIFREVASVETSTASASD